MGRQIPVRTYNGWNWPPPGFLEIDLVAHCGGTLSGSFIHSLVATDICTGWTEAVPLLAREQSLVVEGLEAIAWQLPFPVLGIDSDNDSVFINQTLMEYCADRGIEFTRSRAYRKNGQAWIEQKNGSVVRRFAGHERYSGQIAGQTMVQLYQAVRLHVNYFQTSFLDFTHFKRHKRGNLQYDGTEWRGVSVHRSWRSIVKNPPTPTTSGYTQR